MCGQAAAPRSASASGVPPYRKCGEVDAGPSPGRRGRWPASWRAISRTSAPTDRRRCASRSAKGRDGHIASSPPATSSRSARAFSTGISAGGSRWAKVLSLSSYHPRMASGPLDGCAPVPESSMGRKGSGCSRHVQDDRCGCRTPSRPGPMLHQTVEVGDSATTTSTRGSCTAVSRAASAPLEAPRMPMRRAPPERSRSTARTPSPDLPCQATPERLGPRQRSQTCSCCRAVRTKGAESPNTPSPQPIELPMRARLQGARHRQPARRRAGSRPVVATGRGAPRARRPASVRPPGPVLRGRRAAPTKRTSWFRTPW